MKFKQLHEKATSIAQQKLMALALQHKRGELDADKVTPAVEKLAKSMSEKELDDFASTKHKGLPQKKEDNEISNRSAALKPQMYNDPVTGKKKVRMVPSKSNIVKTNDPEDVKEAHDPKHVKMAIGVASDKRYKQGNYSGAVRAIEKIKKGLSKHPQVAAVLKRQNEAKDPGEYDNEGEMAKTQLKSILRDAEHMIKMFDDEENLPEWVQNKITKAQDYLQSAHSYMMGQDDDDDKEDVKEYLEIGTDAIRRTYAKETPGQTNEVGFQGTAATATRVGALAAVGGAAYAAKKARDRFDPVKVAAARRKKDEKRAEIDKARDELNQRKQYRQKLRDMQRKQRERQASK